MTTISKVERTVDSFGVLNPESRLEFTATSPDNPGMEFLGHVRNGVVVLDGTPKLPEGAAVIVSYAAPSSEQPHAERTRLDFPLVDSDNPGSVHLTNERIWEILNEEDIAPRQ